MQAPEQIGSDHRFASAGGKAQQDSRGNADFFTQQNLVERCADRRVLVVARFVVGASVGHKEHGGSGGCDVEPSVSRVTGGQLVMRRKICERKRAARQLVGFVELAVAMTVGGEHILH